MKKILIVTRENGYLSTKLPEDDSLKARRTVVNESVNVSEIVKELKKNNIEVNVTTFSRLDYSKSYAGWFVVYASSEDRGGFYKGFIEDILLYLKLDGAHLIPSFKYFRAHENKTFAEMMRKKFKNIILRQPNAKPYGNYEELNLENTYPCVIKTAAGSGSSGVMMAYGPDDLKKKVKKLNKNRYYNYQFKHDKFIYHIKNFIKGIIGLPLGEYRKNLYTNKIIVQKMITGLNCDYKVLFYSGKYYVLKRKNREDDFRASGSHKFIFPQEINEILPLLNFAKIATDEIEMPMQSLDICMNDNGECFLIEFQCVNFGPYTLQKSDRYFICDNEGNWQMVMSKSYLEKEYARSIIEYLKYRELEV